MILLRERIDERCSNGDGEMRDEKERILFLIGKGENKIILKSLHPEL